MTEKERKPIYSITPFTLLDYPDHTACILWFAGCNMRCGYCYNPEIVEGKGKITISETLQFLTTRTNLLDGVVLSGGECTLHPDLPPLAQEIKQQGMKVKLDTNGSRPQVITSLLEAGLLDYVALDFKALPGTYRRITGSNLFESFERTLHLLMQANIPFEVRTTLHSYLHDADHLQEMISYLRQKGYRHAYYLQHFVGDKPTLEALPHSNKHTFLEVTSTHQNVIWRN